MQQFFSFYCIVKLEFHEDVLNDDSDPGYFPTIKIPFRATGPTFLTWREPLNHWGSPLQCLDTHYCQYPDHLRSSIQNVSHQSHDRPTPEGQETLITNYSLSFTITSIPPLICPCYHSLFHHLKTFNSPEQVLSQFQLLSLCRWKLCHLHQTGPPQRCLHTYRRGLRLKYHPQTGWQGLMEKALPL